MKITKKIRIFAFMSACLVMILTVSSFAQGFTDDTDEDKYTFIDEDGKETTVRVDYNEVPFMVLDFAVGGQANQGYYRLPEALFARKDEEFEFVVADPYSFELAFRSGGQDYIYSPSASLIYNFKGVQGAEDYLYDYTLNLKCSNGTLYKVAQDGTRTAYIVGGFTLAVNCGSATFDATTGNLVSVTPFREGFESTDSTGETYLVQRAPFGACKVSGTTFSFSVSGSYLQARFKMPLQESADMNYLRFLLAENMYRFSQLLYMVNFDLSQFQFSVGGGYAWKLRYSEQFANTFYNRGYASGESFGFREGNALGYSRGYQEGIKANNEVAYNQGYNSGYNKGKVEGLQSADVGTIGNLFSGIFNGIYGVFHSILDFDIPIGDTVLNFAQIAGAFIALVLIGAVLAIFFLKK